MELERTSMHSRRCLSAFTLTELLVVIVVITVLSSLVMMGINVVQNKNSLVKCLGNMRSVGTAVKAYSTSWNGFTNPNQFAMPALLKYPLKTLDSSYDVNAAAKVRDFICPLDKSPRRHNESSLTQPPTANFTATNAYPSVPSYPVSYQLSSAYIGRSLLKVNGNGILVYDAGLIPNRHPNGKAMGAGFLFSDLHFELSGSQPPAAPKYMPGLRSRWRRSPGTFTTTQGGAYDIEIVWSENLAREAQDKLYFLPLPTATHVTDWEQIASPFDASVANDTNPNNVLGHWDGYLDIPTDGSYTFTVDSDERATFGIDENKDNTIAAGEQVNDPVGVTLPASGTFVLSSGKYYVEIAFWEGTTGAFYFRFLWKGPGIAQSEIPADRLWHLP